MLPCPRAKALARAKCLEQRLTVAEADPQAALMPREEALRLQVENDLLLGLRERASGTHRDSVEAISSAISISSKSQPGGSSGLLTLLAQRSSSICW